MESKALAKAKVERAERATDLARERVRVAVRRMEMALSQRTTAGVIVDVEAFKEEVVSARNALDDALVELRQVESRWPTLGDFDEAGR